MAKLNDLLGVLTSSVCEARVNSDLQALYIAKEYVNDQNPDKELLKHFSIPRMRIDKVEFKIPVGIDKLSEKTTKIYQLTDSKRFSEKAFKKVLDSLSVESLSSDVSEKIRTAISDYVPQLEEKTKTKKAELVLKEFSNRISLITIDLAYIIYRDNNRRKPTTSQLKKLQTDIANGLQLELKDEIILSKEIQGLDNVHVIVEADRLRDIKPENVIMISLTISEQGMEWINMEDKDGNLVTKLMPE